MNSVLLFTVNDCVYFILFMIWPYFGLNMFDIVEMEVEMEMCIIYYYRLYCIFIFKPWKVEFIFIILPSRARGFF